ncbi:MAG TPA: EAL domain-containing protein [Methylophilaceae bacterium]|nr:EAL domain-containing protein [Methylophilaceae bacterium]
MSIKNKISLIVSLLFGVLLIAVAVLFVLLAEEQIRQTAITQQTALVKTLAQRLDDQVTDRHNALITIANALPQQIIADPEHLQIFLSSQLVLPKLFTNTLVYAPDGTVLASHPFKPNYRGTKLLSAMEYIIHTRETGKPYISKLFVSPVSGEPLIVMTAPVLDSSGKVIAIIGGSQYVRKDNLFSGFTDIKIGKTGYMFLLTQDRIVVAHADKTRLMDQLKVNSNPGLEKALKYASFSGESVTSKGVPVLNSFQTMKTTGWIAGAGMPLEEAYEPIAAMYKNAAVAVSALLIILPLLVWLAMHLLTRPLLRLRDEILDMSSNPQNQELVAPARNDEIGQLAEAFNKLIFARRLAEQREYSRNQILEMVARGSALPEIMESLVSSLEQENPNMMCSIVLLDATGKRMQTYAAPSLPDFYNVIVNGLEVGIGVGSCGTAIYTGERVIVEDIRTHEYWAPYTEVAARANLQSCWSEPIKSASGKVLGSFGIYHHIATAPTDKDIQLIEQAAYLAGIAIEQSQANEELQLASLVYQNSSEAMMVTDDTGNILTVNPAFIEVTGYTLEDVKGNNPNIFYSGRQSQAFFEEMQETLNTTGHWQGELWNRRKNGELYAQWLSINTSHNRDGSVYRRVALFSDITQRKESEELIWKQANFDTLTGLPNRRMFHNRLAQEIKKANRTNQPIALIYLDMDRFKEVNDSLGHDMGDNLLIEAAQRLNSCVRQTDSVARLGGDEFTVIMSELDDFKSVERVTQEILEKLSSPYQLGIETVYVTTSIGVTLYPNDASNIDELLRNADQAMYTAKNLGRNRYSYFTQSMQDAAQARIRIARDLRTAITEQQFLVHYQPIIELATGCINKAEALIRWQHPTHGLISPIDFIPVAEETGLIIDIGDWVFHQAATQVANWRKLHHANFQISVNKSPVQFNSLKQNHAKWLEELKSLGLPGDSISVEITEGLLLDASNSVTDKLLEFRDAGIHISLDDFGTGYSSLSYLKKFDIDYIKIDKSFVSNMLPGSDDLALCEAIIVMAHKLGMKVIAEGVETAEQRSLLELAGCDYGQGYLFSRPIPAAAFDEFLAANRAAYSS